MLIDRWTDAGMCVSFTVPTGISGSTNRQLLKKGQRVYVECVWQTGGGSCTHRIIEYDDDNFILR